MNKERSGRYIKCKIVQPGPDLSRPDVGALRPSPEEVWRRREPELVQRSGFKNLPRRRVSFLIGRPTKMDGGGGFLNLFITSGWPGIPTHILKSGSQRPPETG